jgi:hypothetical protein
MKEQVEEQEMTHEELAQRKEEMLHFYKESLPYLQAQHEYEKLLMDIDECRFKRAQYQIQYAMLMNPPSQEDLSTQEELREEIENQQRERKLKKS